MAYCLSPVKKLTGTDFKASCSSGWGDYMDFCQKRARSTQIPGQMSGKCSQVSIVGGGGSVQRFDLLDKSRILLIEWKEGGFVAPKSHINLPFGELALLAGALEAVLFAFLFAGVAAKEFCAAQGTFQVFVHDGQRLGDAQADGV